MITLKISEFLHRAHGGHVAISLVDGQTFTGRFRTDILSPSAMSAFFYGDVRDLSLSIEDIVTVTALAQESLAS